MKILLLVLSVSLLLASCTTPGSPSDDKMMKKDAMMKADDMKKDATMMATGMMNDAMMMSGGMDKSMVKEATGSTVPAMDKDAMMKPTGYVNYDEASVKSALASGQKVTLFFHASWCPSCRALDGAINAGLSSIPSDTLIVKVDYDDSADMKKKYGVISQHTTVMIDADMNLISKKLGARNIGEILN
jgi:thiol-disulfide isomerase/thioredoxin